MTKVKVQPETAKLRVRKRWRQNSWLYLIAALSLALVLWIGWKTDEDVFPYVGVWSGTHQFPERPTLATRTIEFTKDGECNFIFDGTTRACIYQMERNYALVTSKIEHNFRERMEDLVNVSKAIPKEGGDILLFEHVKSFRVDQQTGRTYIRVGTVIAPIWVLHRVE